MCYVCACVSVSMSNQIECQCLIESIFQSDILENTQPLLPGRLQFEGQVVYNFVYISWVYQ